MKQQETYALLDQLNGLVEGQLDERGVYELVKQTDKGLIIRFSNRAALSQVLIQARRAGLSVLADEENGAVSVPLAAAKQFGQLLVKLGLAQVEQ